MSFIEPIGVDTTTSLENELGSLSPDQRQEVSRYIKKLIRASMFKYHDSEALRVERVTLNEFGNRGVVSGTFLNSKESISNVKPISSNLTRVPIEGEDVACIKYDNDYFYTDIINRTNDVNSNIVGGGVKRQDFETQDVPQVDINKGSMVLEGRHGQSIHFDSNNNSPVIKIRAHKKNELGLVSEDLEDDDSSIYLTSDGLQGQRFNGNVIKGKNVFIKSGDIYIKGEKNRTNDGNVFIEGEEIFIHAKSGNTIKMGNPNGIFVPTIDTPKLVELFKNIISFVSNTIGAIGKATNPATLVSAAKDINQAVNADLPSIVDIVENERYLNRRIQFETPDFEVPEGPAKRLLEAKKKAENLKKNVEKRIEQAETIVSKVERLQENPNIVVDIVAEELSDD